jgi:Ferritin-like domain
MSQHRDLVHGELDEVPEHVAMDALNNRFLLSKPADFKSDIDVLNFALTLEYLESTFYEQGNARNLLSGQAKTYLATIQKDEETHVKLVMQTIIKLGGTPVAKPKVNLDGVFASKDKYLTTSFTFENVGVGAYLGAAGYLKNPAILQAAASIFGIEARHAAIVANLLNMPAEHGVYMGDFETPKTKAAVLAAAGPFLGSQMTKVPKGAPNTGGGSTAGTQDLGRLVAGGAALVGGAGVAAYLATHRSSESDTTS